MFQLHTVHRSSISDHDHLLDPGVPPGPSGDSWPQIRSTRDFVRFVEISSGKLYFAVTLLEITIKQRIET